MGKERSSQKESEREVLAQKVEKYIEKNYPVNKTKVRMITNSMELSPMYRQNSLAEGRQKVVYVTNLARDHGFWEDVPSDENIPLMLAAIKMFETRARLGGQILPLSEYIKILAIAESTTAKRGVAQLGFYEENPTIESLRRVIDLVGFHKKLRER
jgi:hypothetical protein